MAFTSAAGHTNLPNGNFSSVIYSKKVQLAFRKSTVAGDIQTLTILARLLLKVIPLKLSKNLKSQSVLMLVVHKSLHKILTMKISPLLLIKQTTLLLKLTTLKKLTHM